MPMQSISFTGTEQLDELARSLGRAAQMAPAEARAVVKRGAQNIKVDAQRRVSGLKHAPAYPRAITYDTHEMPFGASAEIGPDKAKRQGPLGNIIEFGSPTSAPHPHMGPAGDAEEPKFIREIEELALKSLGAAFS